MAAPAWPGSPTGVALIGVATKQKATLIVVGAYTYSRLRQLFLGGVTRHLLTHVPQLMSH
jgi:nucleotide-binding universal stress UspA family protein